MKILEGPVIFLPIDDIDTDRIIPARFLRCVTFDDLGEKVFYDERFDDRGLAKNHPFNEVNGGKILVTGENFGCGSSREHAPQALKRFGIEAIVAQSYAEIFYSNARSIGLPCLTLRGDSYHRLSDILSTESQKSAQISLSELTLTLGDFSCPLVLEKRDQKDFLHDTYDSLGSLLKEKIAIEEKFRFLDGLGLLDHGRPSEQ